MDELYYYILFVFLIIIPIVFILYNVSKKDNTTHDSPSPGNVLSDPKELNSSLGSLRTLTDSIATEVKKLDKNLTETIGGHTEIVKASSKKMETLLSNALTESKASSLEGKYEVKDLAKKLEALDKDSSSTKAKLEALSLASSEAKDKAKLEAKSSTEAKAKLEALAKDKDLASSLSLSETLSSASTKLSEHITATKKFFTLNNIISAAGVILTVFSYYSLLGTAVVLAIVNARAIAKSIGYSFKDDATAVNVDLTVATTAVNLDELDKSIDLTFQIRKILVKVNNLEKLAVEAITDAEKIKSDAEVTAGTERTWWGWRKIKQTEDLVRLTSHLKNFRYYFDQLTRRIKDINLEHKKNVYSTNLEIFNTKYDDVKQSFENINKNLVAMKKMVDLSEKLTKAAIDEVDKQAEKEKADKEKKAEKEKEDVEYTNKQIADRIESDDYDRKFKKMQQDSKIKKEAADVQFKRAKEIEELEYNNELRDRKQASEKSKQRLIYLNELTASRAFQDKLNVEIENNRRALLSIDERNREDKKAAAEADKKASAGEEFKRLESAKKDSKRLAKALAASTEAFLLIV